MQRRRDRINEKMRALQELIPRCNKVYHVYDFPLYLHLPLTICFSCLGYYSVDANILHIPESQSDKASMLDEAIEYLKSLQLQVQVCLCL